MCRLVYRERLTLRNSKNAILEGGDLESAKLLLRQKGLETAAGKEEYFCICIDINLVDLLTVRSQIHTGVNLNEDQ